MTGGGTNSYMALHLKPDTVETPLCPDLAKLDPSSVPAFINDGLREVYGSAKAYNDAVGAEVFKLPSG